MTFYIHDSRYTEFNSKTASANIASGTKVISNWTKTHVSQGFKKDLVVTFADTRGGHGRSNELPVEYRSKMDIDVSGLTNITITNIYTKQDSYSQEWSHGGNMWYRLRDKNGNLGSWVLNNLYDRGWGLSLRKQYGYFSDISIDNSSGQYIAIDIKASGWIEETRGRGNSKLSFSATVSSWVDTSYDESIYTSTEVPSDGNTQTECEIVQSGSYTQSDQIWVKKKGKWEHVHEVYVRENNEWKPVLYEDKYKSYTIPDTTVDYRVPHGVFNLKYDIIGGTGGGQTGWSQSNGGSGVPGEIKSDIIPVTPGQRINFKVGRDGITNPSPPQSYGYPETYWPNRSTNPISYSKNHWGGSPGISSYVSWDDGAIQTVVAEGGAAGIDFKTYMHSGSHTFIVPSGVYELSIDAVGGGGAGYGTHDGDYGRFAFIGGTGAGVTDVKLSVTPGSTVNIIVGSGGGYGYHWTTVGGEGTNTTLSYNGSLIFTCGHGTSQHGSGSSSIKSGISGNIKSGSSSGGPFYTCCDNNACGGNPYQFTSYWCQVNPLSYVHPSVINTSVPLGGTGSQAGWVSIRWGGDTSTVATAKLTQLP